MLSILKMKPEISQKELTYLLDMSKQSLAELLGKLERNGFIVREASEEDKRSVNIKLTEAGAAVAGEMDETPPDLEKLFDCLSEEEQNQLGDYLQRVIDRLDGQFTGDDEEWRRHVKERFAQHGPHFGATAATAIISRLLRRRLPRRPRLRTRRRRKVKV